MPIQKARWVALTMPLILSACAVGPPAVPAKIDRPPVGLTVPCLAPADLAEGATAKDLSLWTVGWVQAYGCERSKRAGLLEAWPK